MESNSTLVNSSPGARLRALFASSKFPIVVVAGVVLSYIVLAVGQALTKHPWMDEAWLSNPALNLLTRGYMGTTVFGTDGPMAKHTYWTPPLFYVAQAAWAKVFGFNLLSIRFYSITLGLLALVALYHFVKSVTQNRSIALLAFALTAVEAIFVRAASMARMDVMSAALGLCGYAAYGLLRNRNLRLALFVSHALVAASGLTHPNGALYLVGLIFLTLYLDRRRLRWRYLWTTLSPYVIGAIGWGAYILEDPANFLLQFGGNAGTRFEVLKHPWNNIKAEITDKYLATYGFGPNSSGVRHLLVLVLVMFVAAIGAALVIRDVRRNPSYRPLLVLVAIHVGLLSVFKTYNQAEYVVHVVPVFGAVLAIIVFYLWTERRQTFSTIALVTVFVTLNVGALCLRILKDDYHTSYLPAVRFVQQHSTPQSQIIGNANLEFGLGFSDNFFDDSTLGFFSGRRPDLIVVDDEYELMFEMQLSKNQAIYRHIHNVLQNEYEKIYDAAVYKVYRRNGARPVITPAALKTPAQ